MKRHAILLTAVLLSTISVAQAFQAAPPVTQQSLAGRSEGPATSPQAKPQAFATHPKLEVVLPDFPADGLILDIGGGGEGVIGQLKGRQVVAIDLLKQELDEAPGQPLLKIVMDARELKFTDASFSTATVFFTFMYIAPADHEKVFRELYRVLRPGGTAFVWTPNLLNYAILASAATPTAFHNWVRHQAFPEDARDNCPTYYRANTPGALTRSLCTAGLRLEGGLRFGAGSYQYWRFSRPLFAAAVLGSNLIARSPLRRLMNVLLARCVKPAG